MSKSLEEILATLVTRRMSQLEANETVVEWNTDVDTLDELERLALPTLVKAVLPWDELGGSTDAYDEFTSQVADAARRVIDKKLVEGLVRERLRKFVPGAMRYARKNWAEAEAMS